MKKALVLIVVCSVISYNFIFWTDLNSQSMYQIGETYTVSHDYSEDEIATVQANTLVAFALVATWALVVNMMKPKVPGQGAAIYYQDNSGNFDQQQELEYRLRSLD